jgi:hypothetical protein
MEGESTFRNLVNLVHLEDLGDLRGSLAVVEARKEFPFPIERVFYEFGSPAEATRANHANLLSRFGYVCVAGACTVDLDDGHSRESTRLSSPLDLLIVDKMVWKVVRDFTPDCVLLVLSDHAFDAADYIRNYDDFLAWSKFGEE